jgi:cell division septal protein FtsQ
MFNINLKDVKMLIEREVPQLKSVAVRRVFPDRLEIDVVSREPVAFIDTAKGLVIDKEGVILGRGGIQKDLVEIKGIRFFFSAPARGERINNAMLDKALMLLEGLREKGLTTRHKVKDIDVSDKNNIQLGILGVKVKMGNNDFSQKTDKLKEILEDPDVNVKDIKYIDLRFEEAVISPR